MFTQIRTSKENREVVSLLTRKLNLGTENITARMAFAYSLSKDRKLDLSEIKDSGGKEYSKSVLFGDYYDVYVGMLCVHYEIYKTDQNLPKYIKLHLDHGLNLLYEEINNSNHDSIDFLIQKIEAGLSNE